MANLQLSPCCQTAAHSPKTEQEICQLLRHAQPTLPPCLEFSKEGQVRVVKDIQPPGAKGAGRAHWVQHAAAAAAASQLKVDLQGRRQANLASASITSNIRPSCGFKQATFDSKQQPHAGACMLAAVPWLFLVPSHSPTPPTLARVPLPQMREVCRAMRYPGGPLGWPPANTAASTAGSSASCLLSCTSGAVAAAAAAAAADPAGPPALPTAGPHLPSRARSLEVRWRPAAAAAWSGGSASTTPTAPGSAPLRRSTQRLHLNMATAAVVTLVTLHQARCQPPPRRTPLCRT